MSKGRNATAMSQAAVNGNLEELKGHLKVATARGTSLNGNTHTACPLIETIIAINSQNQLESIKLLLKEKLIDVNAYDDTGSCLDLAVKNNHPYALEAFKMLLNHPNINVNPVWGPFNITPLHRSIGKKIAPKYLELLLEHDSINVEMLTGKGHNVFHLQPSTEQLTLLLQSPKTTQAMIIANDNDGKTPLDIAVAKGNFDAVGFLLPYYLPFFKELVTFFLCNSAVDVRLPVSATRLIFSFLKFKMEQTSTVTTAIDFMTKYTPKTENEIEKKKDIMTFLDVYFQ